MPSVFIKKLILVDDSNNKIFSLLDCPAEKGLRKAINFIRIKDGESSLRRIVKNLDEDLKRMVGLE